MIKRISFTLCVFILSIFCLQANEAEHNELRELKKNILEAFQEADFEKLEKYLQPEFVITLSDQSTFRDIASLKEYYKKLQSESKIKSIEFQPKSDKLSTFLSPTVATNSGSSLDRFTKNDGTVLELKSRWTATMVKSSEGWRLSTLHAGVDFLDNTYFSTMVNFWKVISLGFSLAFMVMTVLFIRRRKS